MIRKAVEEYIKKIHAKKYSIIIINPLDEVSIISNQPQTWEQNFVKMGLHLRSGLILKAKNKTTPFKWSVKDLNDKDIQIMAEKYNIHFGITFTIKIKYDNIIFTLYFNANDTLFMTTYKKDKYKILFNILHLFESNYEHNAVYEFTAREKEVMNLLKIGKKYEEISIILNITERTVRFHINNVLDKMGTTSVKYAIVRSVVESAI